MAFDSLSEKLQNVFKNLRSKGRLTEDDVKAALFDALSKCDGLNHEPAPLVRVRDYLDSSIQYVIHAWVPTDIYWDVYYKLMEEIKRSFDEHGVAMDYPHMNIHMIGDQK